MKNPCPIPKTTRGPYIYLVALLLVIVNFQMISGRPDARMFSMYDKKIVKTSRPFLERSWGLSKLPHGPLTR